MNNSSEPSVSICMITYNQEPYIRQAIEGVLAQQCDFQYELVIGEDHSKDKTFNICMEYASKHPEIKLLSYNANIGIVKNFIRTLQACSKKYIAFCEGDDFWIDPYKLQKQVEFLEKNPEYVMVAGGIVLVDEYDHRLVPNEMLLEQQRSNISEPTFFDILNKNLINSLTVCARSKIIHELSQEIKRKNLWYVVDYWLWLKIAINHKVYISKDIFAAYRVHDAGISRCSGFLELRIPWIRFDATKNLVNQREKISPDDKVKIFNAISGLIINKKKVKIISIYAFFWLIIHPDYFFAWLKIKSKKIVRE
jgi:glycosyltransferase involved in cell wall biosynthesis